MAEVDLNALSLDELKKLKRDVEKAIDGFEHRRLMQAREVLAEKARELGVTLAEVLSLDEKGRGRRSPGEAKYRNPADTSQTWSGRGRKPRWFADALASGSTADSLLI